MSAQGLIRLLIALCLGIMIGMTWLCGLSWGSPEGAFEQYAYGFCWTVGSLVALLGCGIVVLISAMFYQSLMRK